jgi:hypothetical protein
MATDAKYFDIMTTTNAALQSNVTFKRCQVTKTTSNTRPRTNQLHGAESF